MEFKTYSFKELLSHITDNRGKTCPTAEAGLPLIATNCIKDSGLYAVYENVRYVTKETYDTWFRGHPEPEDLLFVCKGSPGRVAWVQEPVPYCIAQDMLAIRADRSKITPKYLFALLRSPLVKKLIENMHVGTMIPHFKKGDFQNLYLDVPVDMNYQEITGDIHYKLNEKIEHNRQINQTLEQMAQALFKSWFVDFDPVIDNALDAGFFEQESPFSDELLRRAETRRAVREHDGFKPLPDAIRQLFPAAFEECVEPSIGLGGWVPKGWGIHAISDIAFINKESWTKNNAPENIKYVDLSNAKDGIILGIQEYFFEEAPSRARRILNKRDTIFGMVRPANRSFAYVDRDGLTGSTGFVVISAKNKNASSFLYQKLTSDSVLDDLIRVADGAAYPAIKPDDISALTMAVPNKCILDLFEQTIDTYRECVAHNLNNNEQLANLRDTLLPKLISGELCFDKLDANLAQEGVA